MSAAKMGSNPMNCHACARDGIAQVAIAECRFCHVGLCNAHLVASARQLTAVRE